MNNPMPPRPIGIEKILEYLPHRYPFLLIDRVESWQSEPEKRLIGIKNVTMNEPFFPGHFPNDPVMPGVLIVESMAQAAGVLIHACAEEKGEKGPLFYLVKVDKAKFTKLVRPGDQLTLDVTMTRLIRGMGQFSCSAWVEGKKVASCEILSAGRKE
jgi:3-hydroxyacyl-[acyl-carrier-protein] dehydratase